MPDGGNNHRLPKLYIDSVDGKGEIARLQVWAKRRTEQRKLTGDEEDDDEGGGGLLVAVPFTDTKILTNFQTFSRIELSYLDDRVLRFLHRLRPLFLHGNGITLRFHCYRNHLATTRTAMAHLLPLLKSDDNGIDNNNGNGNGAGGIHAFISSRSEDVLDLEFMRLLLNFIRRQFPTQFNGAKLLHIKGFLLPDKFADRIYHWLCSRRVDGKQRMVVLEVVLLVSLKLVKKVQKNFLRRASATPVNFFVSIAAWTAPSYVLRELDAIQEQTLKNAKTGEQLILRKPKRKHLLLSQCPFDVDADCWIQEMLGNVKELEQNQQQQIALENLRLGPIEVEKDKKRRGCFGHFL